MESTLLLAGLIISVLIAYRIGKWVNEDVVEDLQIDNIRLVGKVHRLNRDIDRLTGRKTKAQISGVKEPKARGGLKEIGRWGSKDGKTCNR